MIIRRTVSNYTFMFTHVLSTGIDAIRPCRGLCEYIAVVFAINSNA